MQTIQPLIDEGLGWVLLLVAFGVSTLLTVLGAVTFALLRKQQQKSK
ncbi:hypothetical protein [Anthocerotibacter panamensis]|nr:hypothetical protein [Anthocerotibacter panamensis]